MSQYIHGYTERETQRLYEQAAILKEILHHDSTFPEYSTILEAGCGVGAQTQILASKNPHSQIFAVDISESSLIKAKINIENKKISNVNFHQCDISNLPFDNQSFEHIFVCFVLEHLSNPLQTLTELKRVLKPGGTITIIEGDHGSCFWFPATEDSQLTWQSFIRSQEFLGHDPLIGRRVYPLLNLSGFEVKYVEPRWVYTDDTNEELKQDVSSKIIVPMTSTGKETAIQNGFISEKTWDMGMECLKKTGTEKGSTFFYTWFKGVGIKK